MWNSCLSVEIAYNMFDGVSQLSFLEQSLLNVENQTLSFDLLWIIVKRLLFDDNEIVL